MRKQNFNQEVDVWSITEKYFPRSRAKKKHKRDCRHYKMMENDDCEFSLTIQGQWHESTVNQLNKDDTNERILLLLYKAN